MTCAFVFLYNHFTVVLKCFYFEMMQDDKQSPLVALMFRGSSPVLTLISNQTEQLHVAASLYWRGDYGN